MSADSLWTGIVTRQTVDQITVKSHQQTTEISGAAINIALELVRVNAQLAGGCGHELHDPACPFWR